MSEYMGGMAMAGGPSYTDGGVDQGLAQAFEFEATRERQAGLIIVVRSPQPVQDQNDLRR